MDRTSLLILSALWLGVWCAASPAAPDFTTWCEEQGKRYASEQEREEREAVFYSNQRRVEWLNNLYSDQNVIFALNKFADMTPKEFKEKILLPHHSPPPPSTSPPSQVAPLTPSDLPDSFDWRDKGVVTSVKDQGSVGSCWAFSTVGNVEGQWALAGHTLVSLSAEQLVDCDATFDPHNLHQDCGVFGGWPYLAYQYIKKAGGIEPDSAYPYCSGTGDCYPCVPHGYNRTRCGRPPSYCNKTQSCGHKLNPSAFVEGLKVASYVTVAKNETVMQVELVSRGPLSVLIDAFDLQFYHSGVWDPLFCNPSDLDHAVLLVGYGVDKGLLSTKPYWLIKNSWGKSWGEDGYFRMIRGKAKCGVTEQVTSAVLEQ